MPLAGWTSQQECFYLLIEGLQHLLTGGLDRADVEAGGGIRRDREYRGERPSAAAARPRPEPVVRGKGAGAEDVEGGGGCRCGGGQGHEARWRLREWRQRPARCNRVRRRSVVPTIQEATTSLDTPPEDDRKREWMCVSQWIFLFQLCAANHQIYKYTYNNICWCGQK